MRILTLLSTFFIFNFINAQFVATAPWIENNSTKEKKLSELVDDFNIYWKDKDYKKRGSGFKPFKRWENRWVNLTNESGYIISPQVFWDIWKEKNNIKNTYKNNSAYASTSNWQPVGPFTHTNTGSWSSGQGRVNIVYEDPTNSNIVYIGTPAGGIWKSTDSGINWQPMSDYLPQIGVSGIAVDHTNNNVIYITTGDKDATDTYSIGVLKSTDGGITWNTTGLTLTGTSATAGDIIMHPSNNQILICATSSGIYRTNNAGANWSLILAGNFSQGALRFKPNDPSVVYATGRTIVSGSNRFRFYKSTDNGNNFTLITSGTPVNSGRLILDVTLAAPDYVYLLSANASFGFQGVYRSVDSGNTFTARNTTTNVFESTQAWFDLALGVSDTNPEEIYTGCLNVWKSSTGGSSFTKINNWSSPSAPSYTHADIHYLGFFNGKLYAGTDGGVYMSQDGGSLFTDLTETAQIGQFYKVAVSRQSSQNMVGGLQDNGGYAYSNNQWKNYYGADGMDTAIDPNNPNLYYGFIQFGGSMYISSNGGNSLTGSINAPSGQNGNWVTPLVTNSVGEIYAGYAGLYKLNGGTWEVINNTGLGSGNIELIKIDPTNDDIIYIANGNVLYRSDDRGVNFISAFFSSGNITSIDVNSNNNDIVYISTSGSSGQVLKSTDGGFSFSNIASGLPNIGKNVLVHQGLNPNNPLYVGTSLGVYYIDDTLSTWIPFDTNLPNVSVTDLEINLEDNKIIAATYGRGIWQSNIPVVQAANDIKLSAIISPSGTVSCNSIEPIITLTNNGTNVINNVNINYSINGVNYASNWSGNLTSGSSTNVNLPALSLTRGVYTLTVSVSIANDSFNTNNTLSTKVFANDIGTVGIVNTFENISDELIAYDDSTISTLWTRGIKPTGVMSGGATNNVYTTNLTGSYPNSTKSYLVSQCYNLTNVSNPFISFDMKYDLELNWDLVYVEYSTNFGANWNVLGNVAPNWYNSNRTQFTTGSDCFNCVGAQWTGTNTTNTNYIYPLTSLIGQPNVIFRIVFHSDESVTAQGVNIDNFVITGILSNTSFVSDQILVYPNPTKGLFSIKVGSNIINNIAIYDVTGKLIMNYNSFSNNNEINLDLSNASTGIYFVKIKSQEGDIVKRIVKE